MINKSSTKKSLIFIIALAVLSGLFLFKSKIPTAPAELQGVLRPESRLLQPFSLVDHNGSVFNTERFKGKWSFVFFGYTFCPDVCPITLSVLNSVRDLLKDKNNNALNETQVVFVSVDPERDTPEILSVYTQHFNSEFIGVTGEKNKIDGLTKQFGAGYVFEPETSPGQYTISHTSAIFLVDPLGELVAVFSQPHFPATIATQFEKIHAYSMLIH